MSDAAEDRKDAKPRKVGFGAFSQKYRDRWAVDHPGSARPEPEAAATPATPDVGTPPPDPTTQS